MFPKKEMTDDGKVIRATFGEMLPGMILFQVLSISNDFRPSRLLTSESFLSFHPSSI